MKQFCKKCAIWVLVSASLLGAVNCMAGWSFIPSGGDSWLPGKGMPAAKTSNGSVVFPVDFSNPGTDRMFWDLPIKPVLTGSAWLEMDISIDHPELLRSLMVYLKSGEGWYLSSVKTLEPGRQTIRFPIESFTAEGKVQGWKSITTLRLSPWKAAPGRTQLTLHSARASGSGLCLVQGTSSAPDGAERNFSKRVCERISRWLTDMNIPHRVLTDEDVSAGKLSQTDLAVFCYNPTPGGSEIKAIRQFVARGGKTIVFYSASTELAAMLGFRVGDYAKAPVHGYFAAMQFVSGSGLQVPDRVGQFSGNIRACYPDSKDASVLAWWISANGNSTREPAWVISPRGAWMSHILLEGDTSKKQRMLLAILAHFKPALWQSAAAEYVRNAGKVGPYSSASSAIQMLRPRADQAGGNAPALLKGAAGIEATMVNLYKAGKYAAAINLANKLRGTLTDVYGMVQPSPVNEVRGVWEHDGTGWFPGDWGRTAQILADNGINTLFVNVLWGGVAHYKSDALPRSMTFATFGDQLDQCLRAAKARNMKVHAWKVCWNLQGAPEAFVDKVTREGRVQITSGGGTTKWLCPSHPANTAMALDSLAEIVSRYDVDGIHLDYIRFPEQEGCYCKTCKARFAEWAGNSGGHWPADVRPGGSLNAKFRSFKRDQINLFVRAVHQRIRPLKPGVQISAAVFSSYPDCIASVGQDWKYWIEQGYVDFVAPMNYTPSGATFRQMVARQLALGKSFTGRVLPGLGVSSNESEHRPDQTIEQIAICRELGVKGFVLFDLSEHLKDEVLPSLGKGPLRELE